MFWRLILLNRQPKLTCPFFTNLLLIKLLHPSGASNHCAHGCGFSTEVILDWRPFDYSTVVFYQDGKKRFTETVRIENLSQGGSRMHDLIRLNVPLPRWLRRILAHLILVNTYRMDQLLKKASMLAVQDFEGGGNGQE